MFTREPNSFFEAAKAEVRPVIEQLRSISSALRLPVELMDREQLVATLRPLCGKLSKIMSPYIETGLVGMVEEVVGARNDGSKRLWDFSVFLNEVGEDALAFCRKAGGPLEETIPGIPGVHPPIKIDRDKRIAMIQLKAEALASKLQELFELVDKGNG